MNATSCSAANEMLNENNATDRATTACTDEVMFDFSNLFSGFHLTQNSSLESRTPKESCDLPLVQIWQLQNAEFENKQSELRRESRHVRDGLEVSSEADMNERRLLDQLMKHLNKCNDDHRSRQKRQKNKHTQTTKTKRLRTKIARECVCIQRRRSKRRKNKFSAGASSGQCIHQIKSRKTRSVANKLWIKSAQLCKNFDKEENKTFDLVSIKNVRKYPCKR